MKKKVNGDILNNLIGLHVISILMYNKWYMNRSESILLKSAPNRPPGKHINFDLIAFSCSGQGSLQSNL